ncbi:hypothetical protein BDY24DRAFT_388827 [Mrakia frigida]|uniref:uncharacterized protein n=1 Tax=Mrakia frigida TaxID=29902 RepID=UPI003FCC0E9A
MQVTRKLGLQLMGQNLSDNSHMFLAITKFFGIGHSLAPLVLSRLSIPYHTRVGDLTEPQIASLTAYLSSTTTSELPSLTPVVDPLGNPEVLKSAKGEEEGGAERTKEEREEDDSLRHIEIEVDKKRSENAQIMHLFTIGTWRGRRHRAHKPIRAKSQHHGGHAKNCNKLIRFAIKAYSSTPSPRSSPSSSSSFNLVGAGNARSSPFSPYRSLFGSRFA